MHATGKVNTWIGRGITALAATPFLLSGSMKLAKVPAVAQGFAHFGLPESMIVPIGILELACVGFYLIPPFSVLGAVLLTGFLGGAINTHLRMGEPVLIHIGIGFMIWLGLFLREPRLRELLPVRGRNFQYEREIVINKPRDMVFSYLKFLRNFKNWNPFLKKDPQIKTDDHGTDGEVGFVSSWSGNREVGAGEQEIVRIVEGKKVEFELRFEKPFRATHSAYFSTESMGATQTKVKWGMSGRSLFPMSLFGLFMDVEKMISKDFDAGLSQLKRLIEK